VYLNGDLKPSKASSGRRGADLPDDVRQAPAEYAPAAGRTARVQIARRALALQGSSQSCSRELASGFTHSGALFGAAGALSKTIRARFTRAHPRRPG